MHWAMSPPPWTYVHARPFLYFMFLFTTFLILFDDYHYYFYFPLSLSIALTWCFLTPCHAPDFPAALLFNYPHPLSSTHTSDWLWVFLPQLPLEKTNEYPLTGEKMNLDDISEAMRKLEDARLQTIKRVEELERAVEDLEVQETETLQEVIIDTLFQIRHYLLIILNNHLKSTQAWFIYSFSQAVVNYHQVIVILKQS